MNQEEIWSCLAKDWKKFRDKTPREVEEFLKNKKGKVLDLGCGSGRNIVKNPKIDYYCADFSEQMLEFAQKNTKNKNINIQVFQTRAECLPFKDNFFDSAIFISTLHCIEGQVARQKAVSELYRVLKKGSEAMITVWKKDSYSKLSKFGKKKEGYFEWKSHGKIFLRYYYFYDESELQSLLERVGFKILKVAEETKTEDKHSKKNIIFYVKK